MKRSKDDDVDVNSPLKPVDHPDLEDDRGLMNDDKEQRRCNEEEKDQKAEEPLYDADEDLKSMYSYIQRQGYYYLDKMKEEISDPVVFQVFLKCLHIYGRDIITKQELHLLVGGLLGESADLMKGFNDLLSLCENHQKWFEEAVE